MKTLDSVRAALAGRYIIEREIGRGGMARVYLAKDSQHDRDVAIKVLDQNVSQLLTAERFLREIQITAKLAHPNIIPLLDSGRVGDVLYYVTPYAPGESLRDRINRERQLPLRDALRIAAEIADALDTAHKAGVVHRDVKPENVLLLSGHAVVCDFGIARALSVVGANTLTGAGVSLGTPAYMSPEQAAADVVDGRSDIYALGCVLYEMLAGDPPFVGSNMQRVMAQHASTPITPVRRIRPAVPESVDQLLATALAKSPVDRFKSAGKMRNAIDDILEANASGSLTAQRTVVGRRPLRWVAALVLVVLVALALYFWRRASTGVAVTEPGAARVAVLPMANLSPDPNDRFFAEGMTDELISTLSNIAGLRVIARSSVLPYSDGKKSASVIAKELNVASVVESTCQKIGDQLRVTVRLIDGATQEQRWTEPYQRDVKAADLFAIQRDISMRVAQALRLQLKPDESRRVSAQPTASSEAYELYVRARIILHDRPNSPAYRAALDSATALLTRAVQLDPRFAEAHATLAHVYTARLFRFEPNSDYGRRAAAEIARAVSLDSTVAEAYQARADLAFTREAGWRFDDAIRDYRRAIRLKPNLADAHASFGSLLFHAGILDVARREFEITMQLDPANEFVPPRIARVMWYAGRYDSALAKMEQSALSDLPAEHALVLGYLGRADEGLRYIETVRPTGRENTDDAAARAVLLARLQRPADAGANLRAANPQGQPTSHFHHAEFMIASANALLGRPDEAERWLKRMAEDGMPNYALITTDPTIMPLRSRPTFQSFLAAERARNDRLRRLLEE